jgi:hypothetical protein
MPPTLPTPRGPLTSALFDHLTTGAHLALPAALGVDPLVDDDVHLALWCCHNLHYRGFEGVPEDLEWDPETVAFRAGLERWFEDALRDEHREDSLPTDAEIALRVIANWAGPPLSRTIEHDGVRWQLAEFAVHRSAYQLKEADPHTWAIPRLSGPGRSAMIQIQADEYGGGERGAAHSELFAEAMAQLGLETEFGHYVDQLPGTTLATDNLVTMFGLNRRLRGALVGHLAMFESCSVVPMSRYLAAARRQGDLPALERFYEVHVEADAHHAVLAVQGMVRGFLETEPDLAADVIFGAAALQRAEARFARHLLRAWNDGRTSLRAARPDLRLLPKAGHTADVDLTTPMVDRPSRRAGDGITPVPA